MINLIEKIGLDKLAHLGVGGLLCACITLVMILQDAEMVKAGNLWRAAVSPLAGCALVFAATGIGVLFYILSN